MRAAGQPDSDTVVNVIYFDSTTRLFLTIISRRLDSQELIVKLSTVDESRYNKTSIFSRLLIDVSISILLNK